MIFFDRTIQSLPFVLRNTLLPPIDGIALIGPVALLVDRRARNLLTERKILVLTLSLFLWVLLIPYAIVWSGVDDGQHHRPWWAVIPNWAVLLSWPVLAHRLFRRVGEVRWPMVTYVACNAPCLLFTWFTTTIIVSADWI